MTVTLGRAIAHLYPDPEAEPGEDYVVRLSEPEGEEMISEWNLASLGPQPTGAEIEAAKLEAAKALKVDEFAGRAVSDLDTTDLFTHGHGDRETLFAIAKTLQAICSHLGIPLDARLETIATTGDHAMTKKAEVEAAATLEEVEAIEWGE